MAATPREDSATNRPVGIIGLGIMGLAYARNLLKAGYRVVGSDPDAGRASQMRAVGGRITATPAEVATQCQTILLALPTEAALDAATRGEHGIARTAMSGTIVVEMGTFPIAAKLACRDALAPLGVTVLDCPVSGTGAQAATGDLDVYASGPPEDCRQVEPVLAALSRRVVYLGPFGTGMKFKFIANHLVTIHNLAAAEALALARKAGLDLQSVYDVVRTGAGASRMLDVRAPMMIGGRYEPPTMKIGTYMKDLELIAEFARSLGAATPLYSAALPYYQAALDKGLAGQDTAAIFTTLDGPLAPDRLEPARPGARD
jgi:putative dehydrogenase